MTTPSLQGDQCQTSNRVNSIVLSSQTRIMRIMILAMMELGTIRCKGLTGMAQMAKEMEQLDPINIQFKTATK